MRIVTLLAVLLMLSGCLSARDDGGQEPSGPSSTEGEARVLQEVELLRQSVNTPGPGPHSFTADVPSGGARSVRWQLTIEGVAAATSTVTGHGCSNGANVNLVVGAVVTSTRGGNCDDLGAGPAEFTVMLTDPALAFTVVILGSVVAPA